MLLGVPDPARPYRFLSAAHTKGGRTVLGRAFSIAPPYFILLVNLLFIIASFRFNYPFLLLAIVGVGFNLLFRVETRALLSPFALPLVLGVTSVVSHGMARLGLHGRTTGLLLGASLVGFAVVMIVRNRTEVRSLAVEIHETAASENLLPNMALGLIVAAYWAHSLLFWNLSLWNSTHAHYVQMAQHMLERGYFRFLTPTEDVYNNYNFWYPNLFAHLLAVFGSGLSNTGLIRFAAGLGSFMTWYGWSGIYFLGKPREARESPLVVTVLLAAMAGSYALFRIGPEFESDTPVFFFLPSVYYFFARGLQKRDQWSLYTALLTVLFSFWFRVIVAITLGLALAIFILKDRAARDFIKKCVAKRPVCSACVVMVALMLGSLWQLELWRLTGNPNHPRSVRSGPAGENIYAVTFDSTRPGASQSADPPPAWMAVYQGFLVEFIRRFFHLSQATLWLLTALAFVGIWRIWSSTDREASVEERLSVFVLVALAAILISMRIYYYKFLYVGFLPVLMLSRPVLRTIGARSGRALTALLIVATAYFGVSYLKSGVGTEKAGDWGVLRCLVSGQSPCPWTKDYFHYRLAGELDSRLEGGGRMLFFHLEPGFQLNYYLGQRFFFEEILYQGIETTALHCAQTEARVLSWLHEKRIRVISFSLARMLDEYLARGNLDCPEILPRMLKNRQGPFRWIGESIALVEN